MGVFIVFHITLNGGGLEKNLKAPEPKWTSSSSRPHEQTNIFLEKMLAEESRLVFKNSNSKHCFF